MSRDNYLPTQDRNTYQHNNQNGVNSDHEANSLNINNPNNYQFQPLSERESSKDHNRGKFLLTDINRNTLFI